MLSASGGLPSLCCQALTHLKGTTELAPSEQELSSFEEGYVKQCKLGGSELFLSAGIQKNAPC